MRESKTYDVSVSEELEDMLDLAVVEVTWGNPISELPSPAWLLEKLALDVEDVPLGRSEEIKRAVRDMLRSKRFKPTGMNKPACEYLVGAVTKQRLGPDNGINVAVDLCNVVSLHAGLPISVVDVDRLEGASFTVQRMGDDEQYVFNASGQEMKLDGLICLCDGAGACANPVKDSQRTKTSDATQQVLFFIWGAQSLTDRSQRVALWLKTLAEETGGEVRIVF